MSRDKETLEAEVTRLQRARILDAEIIGRWMSEAEGIRGKLLDHVRFMQREAAEAEGEFYRGWREALQQLGRFLKPEECGVSFIKTNGARGICNRDVNHEALHVEFDQQQPPCEECDGTGTVLDAPGRALDGRAYQDTCPVCGGSGTTPPAAPAPTLPWEGKS